MSETPLLLQSMQGMGDGIHQRAAIRWYLDRGRPIWLKDSPWPELYEDFIAAGNLHVMQATSTLRTQAKNTRKPMAQKLYDRGRPPPLVETKRFWYPPHEVRTRGSVLKALVTSVGCPDDALDFRFTDLDLHGFKSPERKPIMVVRPLVERPEWGGCAARNPDLTSYRQIFEALRPNFHVVSIADLEDGKEWLADKRPMDADEKYHAGEMTLPQLMRLVARASLVLASPGFVVPMAQSLGTPVVCVFGGYESGRSFSSGARWGPYLPIEPEKPCECFTHHHACNKKIDMMKAMHRLTMFLGEHIKHEDRPAERVRRASQLERHSGAAPAPLPQPG